MLKELRSRVTPEVLAKLDKLADHWGSRHRGEALSHLINNAYDGTFIQADWKPQQAKAASVLKRCRPELVFSASEISEVAIKEWGEWYVVVVNRDSVYKISRKEWEK